MGKRKRSFALEIFTDWLSDDERAYEIERLKAIMARWRVPARIRSQWNERIRLGTIRTTYPTVPIPPYTGDALPWEG